MKMFTAGILAGFLSFSASAASAGITRINGDIRAESRATASVFGAEARDFADAHLAPNLNPDTIGAGLIWTDRSDVRAALNGAYGRIDAGVSAGLATDAVAVSNWVEGSAGVADAQSQQAAAQHRTETELFMYFGTPTLVDVVLRIEDAGSPGGPPQSYGSTISLSGLAGQGPLELELFGDGQAFFQELTVRAAVSDDSRPLILRMDTWAEPNPDGPDAAEIGRLSVSASITVVPNPGTPAVLALAAVSARRRR